MSERRLRRAADPSNKDLYEKGEWKVKEKNEPRKIRFTYCCFGKVKILIIRIIFSWVVCIFRTAWFIANKASEFIRLDILIFCQCIFEKGICQVSADFVKNILESFQIISQALKKLMAIGKTRQKSLFKDKSLRPVMSRNSYGLVRYYFTHLKPHLPRIN